jgi:phage-related protein
MNNKRKMKIKLNKMNNGLKGDSNKPMNEIKKSI